LGYNSASAAKAGQIRSGTIGPAPADCREGLIVVADRSHGFYGRDRTIGNCGLLRAQFVRHPIDVATMFAALWLLGSMVLDYFTPKELTIYMIAAATAPAVIGSGLAYYLRFPRIDFVLILTTLWLVAALTIEWISPVPLPGFLIGAAVAPALIVGAILHWHRYRSRQRPG
jgi:hypothetical protein